MKVHFLKCWPAPFQKTLDGLKPWEVRLNDRNYQVGDLVVLEEWEPSPGRYTSHWIVVTITFLLDGCFGLKDGHVCFTFTQTLKGCEGMPKDLEALREVLVD